MTSTAAGAALAPTHEEAGNVAFPAEQPHQPLATSETANPPAKTGKGFLGRFLGRSTPAPVTESKEAHSNGSNGASSGHDSPDEKDSGHGYEMNQVETSQTTFEAGNYGGGGALYNEGALVLIPAPSPDPRDPLNMSMTRKAFAIGFLCVFGALAASAELILGALLPVFAIYYAHIDPATLLLDLTADGGLPEGSNPLRLLDSLPNAAPIETIYLLASLPILMFGLANLVLIPAAIAVGRRPVILFCGICAIAGCLWAGFSPNLGQHLGARCLQALGAGTVESLIPFIVQDMVHVHERNLAISGVFAAQGIIIIALGIAAPYIIVHLSWRYFYWITAAGAGFFLIGCFFFTPETRWSRTKAQMNGERPIVSDEVRRNYRPRTLAYDLQVFTGKQDYKKGAIALWDTLRTFFYPHILFITLLNSAMIAAAFAAGYTVAPALLTAPYSWPFLHLGLCLIPVLIASLGVVLVTGKLADMVANWAAKSRGARVPENQILNLIFPTIIGLIGTILFALGGEHPDKYPWPVFLVGLGFMAFGFLGANTVGAVYVLESYPNLAG